MKPTFIPGRPLRRGDSQYTSAHRAPKFPATDWSFHAPALRGGGASFRRPNFGPRLTPSFRALSDGFFATEAKHESRLEGAVFAVIVALSAWPMVLAVQAAAGLLQ
jgi:hypothetical protein